MDDTAGALQIADAQGQTAEHVELKAAIPAPTFNRYEPDPVENVLTHFVSVWWSPGGRSNTQSWDSYKAATVLSYLFTMQGLTDWQVMQGLVNGERHYWVQYMGKIFDPCRKKFTAAEIAYTEVECSTGAAQAIPVVPVPMLYGNVNRDLPSETMDEGGHVVVQPGQVWQHVKNGCQYVVTGLTNDGNPLTDDNNPPIVDYVGRAGKAYGRYLSSWHGSFSYCGRLL